MPGPTCGKPIAWCCSLVKKSPAWHCTHCAPPSPSGRKKNSAPRLACSSIAALSPRDVAGEGRVDERRRALVLRDRLRDVVEGDELLGGARRAGEGGSELLQPLAGGELAATGAVVAEARGDVRPDRVVARDAREAGAQHLGGAHHREARLCRGQGGARRRDRRRRAACRACGCRCRPRCGSRACRGSRRASPRSARVVQPDVEEGVGVAPDEDAARGEPAPRAHEVRRSAAPAPMDIDIASPPPRAGWWQVAQATSLPALSDLLKKRSLPSCGSGIVDRRQGCGPLAQLPFTPFCASRKRRAVSRGRGREGESVQAKPASGPTRRARSTVKVCVPA